MSKPAEERHARINELVARVGPWEAPHNIYLGDGVWTITDQQELENSKLRRIIQLVSDQARVPLSSLRILDLACEGGIYGIELARKGAEVLGVEGRGAHVERARFAATEIGLNSYQVAQGDVRDIKAESHGTFDVVLCLGILYHLDAPDVFEFVHEIKRLTQRFAILDTQFGLTGSEKRYHQGREYRGVLYREHRAGASQAKREAKLRASLDNDHSFWLTKTSLLNLLSDAGFSSVLEARVPRPTALHEDRITVIANAGTRVEMPSNERVKDAPARWPEKERLKRDLAQTWRGRLSRRVGR